ncbi:MAG: PEP-CTERM sorting domain-containing protein [Proteobacteria bacterium]|nr:PEP-CTERM sorting domain-containing protein [Burkholderiales bacterium]
MTDSRRSRSVPNRYALLQPSPTNIRCDARTRSFELGMAAVAIALCAGASITRAEVIAQWNFNGPLTGTLLPSTGSGTLRPIGVTGVGFGSAAVSGGSSDPVRGNPPNYGWQVSGFPAQGAGSGTAGVQAHVDTSGFGALRIAFDFRPSGSSARHQQFQYALDGISFVDFGAPWAATAGDTWSIQRTIGLGAIEGVDDNPLMAFRLVSLHAPGTEAYQASANNSTYAAQGTWRFDMLTVSGEALAIADGGSVAVAVVPSPGSAALLIAGALMIGGVGARRR